jgi:hypothetical protein
MKRVVAPAPVPINPLAKTARAIKPAFALNAIAHAPSIIKKELK